MKKIVSVMCILMLLQVVITGCSSSPPSAQSVPPIVISDAQVDQEIVSQPVSSSSPEPEAPVEEQGEMNVKLTTVRINIDTETQTMSLSDKLVLPMDNGLLLTLDSSTPILECRCSQLFNGEVKIGPIRPNRKTQNSVIVSQKLNSWDEYNGLGEENLSTTERKYAITSMYADDTFLTQIENAGLAVLVQDYLPKAVWDRVSDPQNFIDEGVELFLAHASVTEREIVSYKQNTVISLNGKPLLNQENFKDLSEIYVSPEHIQITFSTGDVFSIYIADRLMGSFSSDITVKSGEVGEDWSKIKFTGGKYNGQVICYAKKLPDNRVITVVSDSITGSYDIDLKSLAQKLSV